MATLITRYLNTDAVGDGSGTSEASGYTSMNAAITDIAADYPDFTASDVQVDVLCSGTTADNTNVTMSGITTDATRFLRFAPNGVGNRAVAEGWKTDRYRWDRSGAYYGNMDLRIVHLRFDNIQLGFSSLFADDAYPILWGANGVDPQVWFRGCRFRCADAAKYVGGVFFLGNGLSAAGGVYFNNCVFTTAYKTNSRGLTSNHNSGLYAANCTFVNFGTAAAKLAGGAVTLDNVLTVDCTARVSGAVTDNTPIDTTGSPFQGAGDGSDGDVRIAAADTIARNQGLDINGNASWVMGSRIDMDANVRPTGNTWDVGAHEYVAGGGGGGGNSRHIIFL